MSAFVRHLLDDMPYGQAALVFLAQNVLVFAASVIVGALLIRHFADARVTPAPSAMEPLEVGLAISTVVLNAAITFAGLVLYRSGVIVIATSVGVLRVLRDVVVLIVAMDLAMYVLHRLAHHRWLMPILHSAHHRYAHPRPLTLFVLHPFETLAFGALWLAVLTIYETTWLGVAIYLTLNLAFGTIGHLGVEPTPALRRHPALRWIASSTFHAGHHVTTETNFGFYTTVWDRLFGTLGRDYDT